MMHLKAVKSVSSVKAVKTVITSKILKDVKCARWRCLPGRQSSVEWNFPRRKKIGLDCWMAVCTADSGPWAC